MDVFVTKSSRFLGTTSVDELERRHIHGVKYYKVLSTGRHMAIINSMSYIPYTNSVIVIDKKELPLWKKDMQMRMGRVPRPQETRKVLSVHEISPKEASRYRLEVYEIIR